MEKSIEFPVQNLRLVLMLIEKYECLKQSMSKMYKNSKDFIKNILFK